MEFLNIKSLFIGDDDWLLGYDQSGSTGTYEYSYSNSNSENVKFYHQKTQNIENTLLEGKSNVTRIGWDDNIHELSKSQLVDINKRMKGFGGTEPNVLAKYIIDNNFHGNLILISDGAINSSTAMKCSEMLKEWKFKKVFVYLIGTGSLMEESISCAFVRNSPHVIEIYNPNGSVKQDVVEITPESFALLDKIDVISSEEELEASIPVLDNLLMSMNMGSSGNREIKEKLVKLKNRIIRNKSNNTTGVSEISDLISNPNLENLRRVWNLYYFGSSSVKTIEKTLDKYISWCSGALSSTFNRTNINREVKVKVIPPEAPQIVELVSPLTNNAMFDCPITLDGSSNVIILFKKRNESLFKFVGEDKNLKDNLTNCPMNALCNPEVLEYMKGFMDNAISIEAYKELIQYGISDKSPLTRDEIIGGICLGSHDSHVKFSNSIMRQAFTGGKPLGNVDLWFAVIYLMVQKGLVPHLTEQLPFLMEHMIYRLKNSTTYMCLSGLPTYPTYRVPLNIALWSVLSASAVTDEPKEEPVRLHLSYAMDILDLVQMSGLISPHGVYEYINRLECLRCLLNRKKKGGKAEVENIVNALKYNCFQLTDGTFIFIDGKPTEKQQRLVKLKLPAMFEYLSREEIIYIDSICDTQKKESEIDYSMKTKPLGVVVLGAKNWYYPEKLPYKKVNICEKTCRPFYQVGNVTWKEKAKEIYGSIELLSMNKMFGNRVCKIKKYPLKEEFLKYISDYFSRREKETLPVQINQFLDELYEEYKEIMEKVSPKDFIVRWKESAGIERRVQMERT